MLTESALESRFAFGNGFLGMRAARSVSRGPTWVGWLGYSRWASWPRCYLAGLFDMPNTEPPVPALVPIADWSRVRILLDGEPLLAREGEVRLGTRKLDMRRGLLLSSWTHRTPAGITVDGPRTAPPVAGGSRGGPATAAALAGPRRRRRAAGGQFRDGRARHGADAAGAGSRRLAHRGHRQRRGDDGRGDAATRRRSAYPRPSVLAALDLALALRWPGRWPSSTASSRWRGPTRRRTIRRRQPAPRWRATARLGWRAVLAAHEAAWDARWTASDVLIEGDDELQRALRFAVYHLTSAANPEDDRVSIGARALTGDAYLGHVFWDTEIYLLPFYTAVWPEAARALLMYRYHTLPGARAKAAHFGYKGALYAWESADTGMETTPERVVGPDGEQSRS